MHSKIHDKHIPIPMPIYFVYGDVVMDSDKRTKTDYSRLRKN
jgi:hypothetical protein